MTHPGTIAPATGDSVGVLEPEILYLDPDTAALIAEVDAILCAALAPARRSPAPPDAARALVRRQSAGGPCGAAQVRSRRGPVQSVRAVQRSPPAPQQPATNQQIQAKGR